MPLFRPSMVVHIKLKFDEALTLQQPPAPEGVADRIKNPAQNASSPPQQEPLLTRKGKDNVSWVFARIPKTGSVELPGYRQAGQFNLTFDFRDLPIDPRTVRAASVEVHLGVVTDDDAYQATQGRNGEGLWPTVLNTKLRGSSSTDSSTLLMVGTVDEWDVDHGERGSVVSIKGRDLRGILLDVPMDIIPGFQETVLEKLDLDKPINEVVCQLLGANPFFEDINVVVNPAEWPDGEVPNVSSMTEAPRHRKGATGKKKPNLKPAKSVGATNFWDMIVKFCYLVGSIPFFRGTDLVIRPSRNIYDQLRGDVDPVKNPTPFKDGKQRTFDTVSSTAISPGLKFRRFVYGRDMLNLKFNRKFAGFQKPHIVRCVGTDGTAKNGVIDGQWPPENSPQLAMITKVSPGGEKAMKEVLNVPVAGVVDREKLQLMAHSIYEEIARGEMSGSVETANLSSFGGNNSDPDALRLRPGDGVEFLVDTQAIRDGVAPLVSAFTDFNRKSYTEAVQDIKQRLGDENLSRVIVATSRGQIAEMQRFFRVQTVKFSWSEKGVKINFDFQNYYTPRNDLSPKPSSSPGVAAKLGVAGVSSQPQADKDPGASSFSTKKPGVSK